jgi:chromosome segregation ATPase
MKNANILKDELSILNSGKSAVVAEINKLVAKLNGIRDDIEVSLNSLSEVRRDIKTETARLDDIRSRASLLENEYPKLKTEVDEIRKTHTRISSKNAQEERIHLGRIKEMETKISNLTQKISTLMETYDNNLSVTKLGISNATNEHKNVLSQLKITQAEHAKVKENLSKAKEDEKKFTKERLKHEDKIRVREKMIDLREVAVQKREEDANAMANDLGILYSRLKEIYLKNVPGVDVDKLITRI